MGHPLRIGFLASHGGTSMRAVVRAIAAGEMPAQAAVLICNNGDAPALAFARENGVPAFHVSATTEGSPEAADARIAALLAEHGADLVFLSGYLRKLGPRTLQRFAGRVLNIHPALLPKFGGQGMFGKRVHAAVIEAGESVSGATVHYVDGEYDHGATVAQVEVPVEPGDDVEALARRVESVEAPLVVRVLTDLARRHAGKGA